MNARLHPLSHRAGHPSGAQRGVVLVVVLIFMLALAGIAIVSARSALLGEALSRNQLDIQVARQAAEAALRDAERDLLLTSANRAGAVCQRGAERPTADNEGLFNATCIRGQCSTAMTDLNSSDYVAGSSDAVVREAWWPSGNGGLWNDNASTKPSAAVKDSVGLCAAFTGGVPLGTFTGTPALLSVAQQPEYLLEQLKRSGTMYRITARGFGYRAGTEVVMQSYFQVPTF